MPARPGPDEQQRYGRKFQPTQLLHALAQRSALQLRIAAFCWRSLHLEENAAVDTKLDETLLDKLADNAAPLACSQYGIEKESLRVGANGYIAQTPHPRALGAPLTHPTITTDYSEALIELITPPLARIDDTMAFLHRIHAFVYEHLDDELLWASSMPCMVTGDRSIPIANYGSSNSGMMKHVYRRGLGHRYGRVMQAISGVHFNFSLCEDFWPTYQDVLGQQSAATRQDFVSNAYFALVRNFQREGWLMPYLFGSSPAVCQSFLGNNASDFEKMGMGTRYQPYATSLRMSDIGYKNKTQSSLRVSYDDISSYTRDLTKAIETLHPPYQDIDVPGEWRQLNANVLQVENEFYSFIRPKQIARRGEKPTHALMRRGVRYIEVRALDVSVFDATGVNEAELKFVEAFLVYCLLKTSNPVTPVEQDELNHNQQLVACCGREPGLALRRSGDSITLKDWGLEICAQMEGVCELLDRSGGETGYSSALAEQREGLLHAERLPSARVLDELKTNRESFFEFAMRKSQEHRQHFASTTLSAQDRADFDEQSELSHTQQAEVEASDTDDFTTYLAKYFAQTVDSCTDPCTDDAA